LRLPVLVLIAALYSIAAPAIESVPKAVIADPPPDAKFPARMEVIHVPSGGEQINGVVYVASGERPHPAFVFFHGLPGNEKNLDLAQAVRRAGWTVVTDHSWSDHRIALESLVINWLETLPGPP
jgi:uncharacterized protein